jgi:hypothetical protein
MKPNQHVKAHETRKEAGARATHEFNQEFLHKRLSSKRATVYGFVLHFQSLPFPGEGGVHGGSRLLGPAAADAEGVLATLGGGRFGRKREHFKLGVVFMIACVENSLFWSRAAAGRQAPPAACDSLAVSLLDPRRKLPARVLCV